MNKMILIVLLFGSFLFAEEYIHKKTQTLVSAGVGQPLNLDPPASLNFVSLAASTPLALTQIQGASLADSQPLNSFVYTFRGKHFVASYLECDLKAISHLDALIHAMDGAVVASGATILDKTPYVFPPNGLTIVYLLSESHASLHTYPEHGACFVDLFTCGDTCSAEKFDALLRAYLQPKQVNAKIFLRGEDVQELPFP